MTVADGPAPTWLSRVLRRVFAWFFRVQGWTAVGAPPPAGRCIILAVPHTSNWDFIYTMGLFEALEIRPKFMAKDSLFRAPMGRFMRDMGGVPVKRSRSHNMVDQMAERFADGRRFMLVIAPEGTREAVGNWKTGFYHMAMKAQVPIVAGFLDYGAKQGGLGPAVMPTGNYRADMEKIVSSYDHVVARHPERAIQASAVLGALDDKPPR